MFTLYYLLLGVKWFTLHILLNQIAALRPIHTFTQCGRVWFTLAMPRPCHTLTMRFFSRPRYSTAVERRPVGYLPVFGFFRLPVYCMMVQQHTVYTLSIPSLWTLGIPNVPVIGYGSRFQTFAVFCMLYIFFWVIPRRLNFICRHFGTLCLFHLHRQVGK
jgi:hypothetical protein